MNQNKDQEKQALLDELNDIQSLLDEETRGGATTPRATTHPERAEQIRRLASERANPFLGSPAAPAPASAATPAAGQPRAATPTASPGLSEQELDRMVDALVDQALPKLEQQLRARLKARLRQR
ncbi:hypothetical protein A11A3_09882 [Alcanivorax hongdengensis A-11-3]|uniref:Uncharacterized protein n=1 Tax=Alcanivorax hongdengensis A-11-3 TaxID=1177179 RepID=L0WAT8_9GAMM|nr:hypothetical protein [Alcanivorax hongdengensis]EKF74119.1 hypothetical protein A11A3_09882 [Alcanivorax hongdengensis A-11-3]